MNAIFLKHCRFVLYTGAFLLTAVPGFGIDIQTGVSTQDLVNQILGPGITIVSRPLYVGAQSARGTFNSALGDGLGMDTGVILCTGQAVDAIGPNGNVPDDSGTGDDVSMPNNTVGDNELSAIVGPLVQTHDASALIFDFIPGFSTASVEVAFASEEYNEFVFLFNDIFGVFIQYPGSDTWTPISCPTALSVNQVNSIVNRDLFFDNSPATPPAPHGLAYDGFTVDMIYRFKGLVPGQIHKVKFVVADAGDPRLDSAAFLKQGSFTSADPVTAVVDTTFNPGSGANNSVHKVIATKDQKVIIVGNFSSVNGVNTRIARLNANGTVDTTFNCSLNGSANALARLPDGKILIGGGFTTVNGQFRPFLARLNPDGTTDTSFNQANLNGGIIALVVQSDGKIVVAGGFTVVTDYGTQREVARFNSDGTLDTSFSYLQPGNDFSLGGSIWSLAVDQDEQILVGGFFRFDPNVSGGSLTNLARLRQDGSIDYLFLQPSSPGVAGPNSIVRSIVVQPDRQILIGGNFTTIFDEFGGSTPINRLARLNTDGSLDSTFNTGSGVGANAVHAIGLGSCDGQIIVSGSFTSVNGVARNRIARLNADGSLDTIFDPGTGANSTIGALCVQGDGKVVIGGLFTTFNGTARNRIARLNLP